LAQLEQKDISKAVFINGVIISGITLLCPMIISRPEGISMSVAGYKTIPFEYFNEEGESFIVGFRVDSNKTVKPICLLFDKTSSRSESVGIGLLKCSVHDWVDDFQRGEHEFLQVSHNVSEKRLDEMVAYLTSDNSIVRGKLKRVYNAMYKLTYTDIHNTICLYRYLYFRPVEREED